MAFEIILTILIVLTLILLIKIFHVEQSQQQHYQHLTKELKHFGHLLETINLQLGKFSKLVVPSETPKVETETHPVYAKMTPGDATTLLQETSVSEAPTTLPTESEKPETRPIGIADSSVQPVATLDITLQVNPLATEPAIPTSVATLSQEEAVVTTTDSSVTATPTLLDSARDILKTLWSWIIVGEEYRSKQVSMEYAIATTWLLRFGMVAILFAMGYFLKYSIVKGHLVPAVRIIITLLVGLGMLLGGLKLLRSKYYLIGQGLMGGGLAMLYFSIYAATIMYQLIPLLPTAFASMILVTITVASLAIPIDSLLLAIFAIVGGYATPLLLWVGHPNMVVLYSYVLLLGLGILGIAHYKQWRLLNYLAFVFNYLLFFISLLDYQNSDVPLMLTFLTLFFVLHSALVYIYNIAKGEKTTLLEIGQLIVNAAIYTAVAYYLIETIYGKSYPALLSLSLAWFYAVHAYLFLKHRPIDRNLIISLTALAGFYITWTMPLVFERESLTSSWSVQAFLFLWLGLKLRSNFIKNLAYLLYLLIFVRLLYFDVPRYFELSPQVINFGYYLSTLGERVWTFGMGIAAIIGAFLLLNRPIHSFLNLKFDPHNDTPPTVGAYLLEDAFYWSGLLFLFLYLHLEFNTLFSYYEPLRLPMLTLLWCGMVVYFLHRYLVRVDVVMLKALLVFLTVAIIKLFALDIFSWQLSSQFIYEIAYTPLNVSIRAFDFGIVMGVLYACWRLFKALALFKSLLLFLFYNEILIGFSYLSLELNSLLYWKLPEFQVAGMSILWALLAIIYLTGGIWGSIRSLRYLGLTLFIVVIGKVFLVDLAQTATLYRVLAFLLIGVILLVGSFAYIYSRQKFEK